MSEPLATNVIPNDKLETCQSFALNSPPVTQSSAHTYRKCLPSSMIDRSKFSIWSILKQCVDKELYRFTLPIIWNEPLSLLQRMAENMKYADDILDLAADLPNPIDRMKYVAAFQLSATSIHVHRLSKPFNPLLGETFEYVSNEKNFRICCEQVSHHPPISAYHSESIKPTNDQRNLTPKWKYYGSVNPHMKLNLLNACVEAYPEGIQTVEFPSLGEVYTWHNLKISAHNLILGKLWFEYTGRCEIINHKLKLKCILEYKPYSWFSRQLNRVEGYILDSNDNKVALLNGKWDEFLYATNSVDKVNEFNKATEKLLERDRNHQKNDQRHIDGIELLWKVEELFEIHSDQYNFNNFTFTLNDMYEDLTKSIELNEKKTFVPISIGPIPKTDCRLRPDIRLLEKGQSEIASGEKNRLEEQQRETQRKIESGELQPWKPLWFDKKAHIIVQDEETWSFNDKYWQRDYSNCPNIY